MSVSTPAAPLFTHLKGQRKGLSRRQALRMAFVLGLASLLFCMGAYFSRDENLAGLMVLFGTGVLVLSLVTPPIIAAIAVSTTARDLKSEAYRSLARSDIANSEVVRGYVGSALFRARVVLVLVVGLMPVLVLGVSYTVLLSEAILTLYNAKPVPIALEWQNAVLGFLAFTLGLWGLSLLASALGVWLVLWRRHAWVQPGSEPSGIPVRTTSILAFVLMIFVMIGNSLVGARSLVVLMVLPYLLAAGLIFLTGHWARRAGDQSPA